MATDDQEAQAPTTDDAVTADRSAGNRSKSAFLVTALLASLLGSLLTAVAYWQFARGDNATKAEATEKSSVAPGEPPAAADPFSAPLSDSIWDPESSRPADPKSAVSNEPPTLQSLREADRLLLGGEAAEALSCYARLTHSASPHFYDSLLYRAAVARELLGDLPNALTAYRQLVERSRLPQVIAAGKLGQSRVWVLSRKPELAIPVLSQLTFSPIVALHSDDPLAAEVHHLLAIALDRQANPITSATSDGAYLLEDSHCANVSPNWSADFLMSLPVSSKGEAASTISDGIDVLYQFGKLPEEIQLSVSLPEQQLAEVVDQIASQAEAKTKWSAAARKRVAQRSTKVLAPSVSFAVLLDTVLAPYDLIWISRNGELLIQTTSETADVDFVKAIQSRAVRALQSALVLYPDHHLAATNYLALGDSQFESLDYEGAEATYRQLIRLYSRSPAYVAASLNVAKSLMNRHRLNDAANAFYDVVDSAHGHPLRAVAYLYVGRIHLESGNLNAAIRPLMRAAVLATDSSTKSAAAVTLSTAYFLADNPHAANTVLMKHRQILKSSNYRGGAALLTAMSQLTAAGESPHSRSGRAVVNAVNQVTPDDFFGPSGYLLVGRGMASTGLMEQAALLYEGALQARLPAWVSDKMREFLVDYRILSGEYSKAEEQLAVLRQSSDEAIARQARVYTVKLAQRQGSDEAFVAMCRELLEDDLSTEQKAEVLKLMGHAFEADSRHYEAALCFAGMIPPRKVDAETMRSTLAPKSTIPSIENRRSLDQPNGS